MHNRFYHLSINYIASRTVFFTTLCLFFCYFPAPLRIRPLFYVVFSIIFFFVPRQTTKLNAVITPKRQNFQWVFSPKKQPLCRSRFPRPKPNPRARPRPEKARPDRKVRAGQVQWTWLIAPLAISAPFHSPALESWSTTAALSFLNRVHCPDGGIGIEESMESVETGLRVELG